MSASLSGIPVEKRRQLSGTLGLFAVLLTAVGAVAATGSATAVVKSFVVIALLGGVLLAMLAWGVALSVKLDLEEMRLDTAVEDAIAAHGTTLRDLTCGCGHEHDPNELHVVGDDHGRSVSDGHAHVVGDPCSKDGTGIACTQSCDTCVLASRRPAPSVTRPSPRPSPGRVEPARPSPAPRAS